MKVSAYRVWVGVGLALCLVVPRPVAASTVVIRGPLVALDSPQQPRIVVRRDGSPLGDVTLEVYRRSPYNCFPPQGEPQLTLRTDEHGQVRLPQLPPDGYYIIATAGPNLRQQLCLTMTSLPAGDPTTLAMNFAMDLVPYTPPPALPTLEEMMVKAERSTDVQVIPQFSGVVSDASGARIPNAVIEVAVKGTGGRARVGPLRTDQQGHFSADLPEGTYIAVVRSPGFTVCYLSVTISKAAGARELQVVLLIGALT